MIPFIIITSHFYSAAHLGLWRPIHSKYALLRTVKMWNIHCVWFIREYWNCIDTCGVHKDGEQLWVSSTIAHKFLTFSAKHQDHDQLSITMKARRAAPSTWPSMGGTRRPLAKTIVRQRLVISAGLLSCGRQIASRILTTTILKLFHRNGGKIWRANYEAIVCQRRQLLRATHVTWDRK